MTIRTALLFGAVAFASLLAACGGTDLAEQTPQIASTFTTSTDGWQGAFSDYHDETKPTDVILEPRALPAPLSGSAYFTGGTNRSDDLFIYSKKKFGGYAPSTSYKLRFEIEFVSNQSSGCVGVGGAPGESVYVVAGASPTEPQTVLTAGEYVVNVDRGNQAMPGTASQVLGNVANGVADCGPKVYQPKVVKSTEPLLVKSDGNGNIWVFFGIDSGFEAKSSVFYKSIKVAVDPVQ